MAVRIRVYPQGTAGVNGFGNNLQSMQALYNSKLQAQKQISSLQLGYERQLANERIKNATMEVRLQNPYMGAAALGTAGMLGLGTAALGSPLVAGMPVTGMPVTGMPISQGMPGIIGGSGQTNITNQTSTGGTPQNVVNNNVKNVTSTPIMGGFGGFGVPAMQGWGVPAYSQFGGGGFLSSLLGALV